jgi:hypothetical protein
LGSRFQFNVVNPAFLGRETVMESEQVTSTVPAPPSQFLQAWLARLGLSGKLLAIGGLVGVIAVFLPLLSMSMQMPTPGGANVFGGKAGVSLPAVGMNESVLVVKDWRGVICLIGYLAALALTYVLYLPNGLSQKSLGWASAGVGALIALLALWLLASAFSGSSSLSGFGASFQVSVGIGAILNVLAAAAVAAGGFLKAREEKLI